VICPKCCGRYPERYHDCNRCGVELEELLALVESLSSSGDWQRALKHEGLE